MTPQEQAAFTAMQEALEAMCTEGERLGWHVHPKWSTGMANARAALSAAKAVQPRAQGEALEQAYERGWIECACWARRDDLYADVGSPAYIADRTPHLDAVKAEAVAYVVALPGRPISMTVPVCKMDDLAKLHNAPLYTSPPDTEALRKELERVKGERSTLLNACKRAINYANNVGKSEGVTFDDDDDLPAILAAIAAQGEQ